jgi:2-polyprenyl-6-methoxyphenol hydroxylase-like FAD-dependent oxidoreductase
MHRNQTVLSQKPGLSRYWQCLLNQGRLEAIFLDLLERKGQVSVERNIKTLELITDPGSDERSKEYPISLRVHNPLSSDSSLGHIEELHAKYVIACDGAHSWTRSQLRISLEGQHMDGVWGVMDIVPLTDFRKSSEFVFGMLYLFVLQPTSVRPVPSIPSSMVQSILSLVRAKLSACISISPISRVDKSASIEVASPSKTYWKQQGKCSLRTNLITGPAIGGPYTR